MPVAPRPLLVESGTGDDLFPFAIAAESVRVPGSSTRSSARPSGWCMTSSRAAPVAGNEALPFLDHWLGLVQT